MTKIILGVVAVVILATIVAYVVVQGNKSITSLPTYEQSQTTQTPKQATPTTPISTLDWKVYENKELGFSFKYPNDWELKSGKDFVTLMSPATKQELANCAPPCELAGSTDIGFSYYSSISEVPTDIRNKSEAKTIDELITNDETKRKLGTRSISGVTAVEIEQGGAGATYNLYIEKTGHIYVIGFDLHEKASDLSPIENQILSTFQFTK